MATYKNNNQNSQTTDKYDYLDIDSEDYAMNPKKFEDMGTMVGKKICPVDLNDAFVSQEKDDPENLNHTEANIQRRFNLKPKEV